MNKLLILTAIIPVLCVGVWCKECTNIPTNLSSHTFRYELLRSHNEALIQELYSQYHLTPTDDSAWSGLLREKTKNDEELEWAMTYKIMKNPQEFGAAQNLLKEVSLHDVRLDPMSVHGRAQQTNLEYLLMLDVDRLVWSFRKTAGLPTQGEPYGGWEAPNIELRGHFVGHYLSATAKSWASTHNETLRQKMNALVSALSACQEKFGNGYLSAFPTEFFDRVEAIRPVWAPYYTIHKIMAGLLDQYVFAGNGQALQMVTSMANYFHGRVKNVIDKYSIERHWTSLNEECGGMNDVLYNLYSITKDPRHVWLAHLFDKPCFLGLLAVEADNIAGFHANTHIPIVVGAQKRYETTGDQHYEELGKFFMDIVNSSHSYATGGTSVNEFWSNPKRLASDLSTETEESCTTYNMLKVSRNVFRWTKETAYADHYERALTNGVLSIQRGTEPGVMIYMLPLGRGVSKARSYHGWGTKFDTFWCCYGTGIESFSKLGDSIYFVEEGNVTGLYVIQYISSSLDWKSANITLTQKVEDVVSWEPSMGVTFVLSPAKGTNQQSALNVRIPIWTDSKKATATLNGEKLVVPTPGQFLSVHRTWNAGDTLSMKLPISLRTEAIKDDRPEFATVQAILYGPYLLAGHSNGDWDIITKPSSSLSDWIAPVSSSSNAYLVTFSQVASNNSLVITNSNMSITMQNSPQTGTDAALHATFKLIPTGKTNSSNAQELVGNSVLLEPYDLPGMVVAQEARDSIIVRNDNGDVKTSTFRLISGLNQEKESFSLESESRRGCYISSDMNSPVAKGMKLICSNGVKDERLEQMASFKMEKGLKSYHPISFVAKGTTRSYLLEPLLSFMDESYTPYFNVTVQA